jgi:hypothetical protein
MSVMICVVLGISDVAAGATILFNNFGPGDAYNTVNGYTIGDDDYGQIHTQGEQFIANGSGNFFLTKITIAFGYHLGTNAAMLSLYSDAGNRPGALLESWTFHDLPVFGAGEPPVDAFSNGTLLTGGTAYWLLASGANNESLAWNLNSIGEQGLHLGDGFISPGVVQGAFRVEASPVPEPAAYSLLSFAALFGLMKGRQSTS